MCGFKNYLIVQELDENTKKNVNSTPSEKNTDRDRTRTCNPQIRSLMPYPLGHTTPSYP